MVNVLGDRFLLFCGVDDLVFENVLLRRRRLGLGPGQRFPARGRAPVRPRRGRRCDAALALYRWFMPLLHLDVDTKLVQYIKLANS